MSHSVGPRIGLRREFTGGQLGSRQRTVRKQTLTTQLQREHVKNNHLLSSTKTLRRDCFRWLQPAKSGMKGEVMS